MTTTGLVRRVFSAGAVLAIGMAVVLDAFAPAHAVSANATTALDWIEGQMAAHAHHLVRASVDDEGEFVPEDDVGLTIDALLAIAGAGRSGDAEAQAASGWVVDHVSDYVSGASTGDAADSRYAGELGKFLLLAQQTDLSGDTFDGINVESDLRELMATNGRFVDRSDFGDLSNGVKQALDVLALALTDDGVAAAAVDFLLLQQCPGGGFRIQLGAAQCANDTGADLDATSFALMALRAAGSTAANADGLAYLVAQQADNGGFGDNANSTGLAAAVLRENGHAADADRAAAFVESLQLTSDADAGAILLDEDGYDAAVAEGLDEPGRTIAARATSQGVLAFGLPSYDRIGAAAPPTTTTTTSTTSTSTTVLGGASTTTSSTSTTVLTITSTTRPVVTATTVAGASIARAGSAATREVRVAAGVGLAGVGLVLIARRRRIVYPFKK